MIVSGIDLDRKYDFDEIADMHNRGKLRDIAIQGYVCQADPTTRKVGFVPWQDAASTRMETNRPHQETWDVGLMQEQLKADHPMRRRTPQERVASMVVRLMDDARRDGTIAGLTDEQISTIVGEAWKTGESWVTHEMVQKVAAYFLGMAEVDNRAADAKRVTRAHPFA